ncbi:retrovirus-related pol polyprotein from transposon TNT 1-94 [Tanacetum coccineum]|uniref:Retrovirus-related pol polyprotein from transposon TNT 1-94 n=1 Tax=Tanacetum coccineum TaxID=301880 RepID=A0ABQ5GIT6_9ASTR
MPDVSGILLETQERACGVKEWIYPACVVCVNVKEGGKEDQTKEDADTLREIVEQVRALKPFDNALDYAYPEKLYEDVGITHQTLVVRTPQQNGIVERRNRTLVEDARTMLIFLKAPLFLWAEAVATAYLKYLYVFGALCYPTNDSEDPGKLKPKADISIFIGLAISCKESIPESTTKGLE